MKIDYGCLACSLALLSACSPDPLEPDARRSLQNLVSNNAKFRDLTKSTNPQNPKDVVICGKVKDREDKDYVRFIGHLPPAMPTFFERGGTQSLLLNLAWGVCEGRWNDPISSDPSQGDPKPDWEENGTSTNVPDESKTDQEGLESAPQQAETSPDATARTVEPSNHRPTQADLDAAELDRLANRQ
ncbi:hypothetical protein SPKIRA_22320 [Sphingomonas paucimobilis]|uniref:Lipoprotein n=2 Tax=Sphingomonas paucimobilis TaxID=13689 RepID=A0A411LK75_SPHPI|nr:MULTISPECIES: hypothetical protein [Sphingomonas]MCM3678828.1 hypothetical protein [Sphingomonas paucimobilis]NNG58916.1 hypothetical protein [Sphingomonas paucimobilis]QBE92731.1 hypothetical protein DRN02_012420 [Sphingomonas paucimobilis]QPS17720.1 hypothetical protein I6G65_09120 [Sphingomonas paucimobilis]QPT09244.1 hypothetical protein I6G38_02715 [Sphingomonas paucimobilis]